jgi:hypothetical protein
VALAGFLMAPAIADWDHPIKWDQMQIDGTGGHSTVDYDGGYMTTCADDFLCSGDPAERYITDIHWAGFSYYGNQYISGFKIQFWTDVPATPNDESHPGELLYEYDELMPYDGFFGWHDLGDGTFRINLPEDAWFDQGLEERVLWISIRGIMVDDGFADHFYWNFRDRYADNWGDDAAFESEFFGYPPWANWGWVDEATIDLYEGPFPDGWWKSADMAFALTAIPEPAALLLLGLGFLAIRRR